VPVWDAQAPPPGDRLRPGGPPQPGPGGTHEGRGAAHGRRPRLALLGFLAALAGLAASLTAVVVQLLPRSFTTAQQRQIGAWEISSRWRSWPAGRIFPPTVRYQLPGAALASLTGLPLAAHRAGIAPQASCQAGTDPAVARALTGHGCLAVLRATYGDATGSMAVTVGVAVFPDAAAELAAARALPGRGLPAGTGFAPGGVLPVRFRGTPAGSFGPAQRQLTWAGSRGPYLILADAGYSDGRPRVRESADPYALTEMRSLAQGAAASIGSALDAAPPLPHCPGAPGC
jgi:hypothetical protein